MRLPFLFLFLALTGWCVETVLTVDTAQPKALLPYQTFDQGASYDYRVNVKANGMRAALTGADAGVIQFASTGTSVAWAIFTSTSVNTNTGSFLIPVGPLAGPLGDGVYQVYLYNTNTPSRKYSVGGGSFRMEETTGFGSPTASYYLVPLNTDLVEQTGSNRFVRLSELGTDWGDWRLPVFSNQSAIAILNTGKLDVAVALAALAARKVKLRWDTSDANVYDTIEGGTNWVVYRIENVQTNYSITYSADFRYDDRETVIFPPMTNAVVVPYNYAGWTIELTDDRPFVVLNSSYLWSPQESDDWPSIDCRSFDPVTFGTATVSRVIVYPTNEIYRVDIPALTNINAVIQSIRASLTSISNTAEQAALDALSAQGNINNHTANGGIHVTSGDKELINAVPGITQSVAAVSCAFAGFTNSIPAAGCTALSMTDETNLVVTGATYAYTAQVTTNYWLSIAPTAPAYHYSLTVYGTNACTLADNMRLIGTKTETGTNCVAFKPWTNDLWEVMWGGK